MLRKYTFWQPILRALALAALLCAGPHAEAQEELQPEMVRNVWGQLVEKPRYGGTITLSTQVEFQHTDPWYNWNGTISGSPVLEKLGIGNWAIPREEYEFTSGFVPIDVIKPHLAEKWEMPDPTTIIFTIRKGIYWQNKPPVNGRELDAYDVEISLQRAMGVGPFASQGPSPYAHMVKSASLASAEAIDRWTVVVKQNNPRCSRYPLSTGNPGRVPGFRLGRSSSSTATTATGVISLEPGHIS